MKKSISLVMAICLLFSCYYTCSIAEEEKSAAGFQVPGGFHLYDNIETITNITKAISPKHYKEMASEFQEGALKMKSIGMGLSDASCYMAIFSNDSQFRLGGYDTNIDIWFDKDGYAVLFYYIFKQGNGITDYDLVEEMLTDKYGGPTTSKNSNYHAYYPSVSKYYPASFYSSAYTLTYKNTPKANAVRYIKCRDGSGIYLEHYLVTFSTYSTDAVGPMTTRDEHFVAYSYVAKPSAVDQGNSWGF